MAKPLGNKAKGKRDKRPKPETALRQRICALRDPTRPKVSIYKWADAQNPARRLFAYAVIRRYGRNTAVAAWVIRHYTVIPPEYEVTQAIDSGRVGRWVQSLREGKIVGRAPTKGQGVIERGRKNARERMPAKWRKAGEAYRTKRTEEQKREELARKRGAVLAELNDALDSLRKGSK